MAEAQLEEREKQEELMWWKKSQIKRLLEGEKITKFFHNSVIQNRFHNKIYSIKNAAWVKVEAQEEIEDILNAHFSDILMDPRQNYLEEIEVITHRIPSLGSKEQNQLLMKTITH